MADRRLPGGGAGGGGADYGADGVGGASAGGLSVGTGFRNCVAGFPASPQFLIGGTMTLMV